MRMTCISLAILAYLGALAGVITTAVLGGENSTKPVEIAAAIAVSLACAFMAMGASLGAMAFRPTGAEPQRAPQNMPMQYPGQAPQSGPIPQQHPAAPGQWPGQV
ncbi:hypothetical protein [Actinokineospora sp.]|uniref:hypothetical protein n=1 Tax=Actinokineospora sp. TaxID=1872133 RepID=UPI003D6AB78E